MQTWSSAGAATGTAAEHPRKSLEIQPSLLLSSYWETFGDPLNCFGLFSGGLAS